ncbi:JAB domain-containing protein [Enterococcus cecorum]|uniref:JAB domain-containing protein n=1 Tax=Enterococcus cecorum TaxID=44008 RepID=UPI0022DC7FC7|nr:JAB domain-containing protein [Enterococcus cecorum]CAI3425768.1 JAB domain-containing protein [Enterococcus cecorum]CAI3427148.1 JAB domain-containing protein [Enterococcus cecorum]CAI3433543.1 JAB domain-containing protein [Enterococcus cecorum]CAI3444423.1 JAB domain-containing protein [Enterococcus cecorum]
MEKEIILQEISAVYQVRKDVEVPITRCSSAWEVGYFFSNEIGNLTQERLVALFLNTKNQVLAYSVITQGSINQSIANPRDILQRALLTNSAGLIIAHNHPSGDLTPSEDDKRTTKRLKECCEMMGIMLLDHFIVSEESHLSFASQGLL